MISSESKYYKEGMKALDGIKNNSVKALQLDANILSEFYRLYRLQEFSCDYIDNLKDESITFLGKRSDNSSDAVRYWFGAGVNCRTQFDGNEYLYKELLRKHKLSKQSKKEDEASNSDSTVTILNEAIISGKKIYRVTNSLGQKATISEDKLKTLVLNGSVQISNYNVTSDGKIIAK